MSRWLYGEGGYYTLMPKIGKEGDFYTSVSTSMFFGGSVGKLIVDMVQNGELNKSTCIVEIGAHKGYMLADAVQFIYSLDSSLLKSLSFAIIEPLKQVRKAQREYMYTSFADSIDFKIYSSLEEFRCEDAFFFSNELFDAFACEVINDNKML